jgi:MurNAc alpha-1-phosphate uridylyltransferase
MKVMILAAGLGERLRPLTHTCPKPLIKIGQTTLIEHLLEQLKQANFTEIVINTFHLAEKIQKKLKHGQAYGVSIQYSDEKKLGRLLDTGGGIRHALSLLGNAPFLVISADIWTDFPFETLRNKLTNNDLAHLVFIPNSQSEVQGVYDLHHNRVRLNDSPMYTYANIGIFSPHCFVRPHSIFPLRSIINRTVTLDKVSGEIYKGVWYNMGTPEKLRVIQQLANKRMHL